jgi:hypothetical protein
VRDLLLLLIRLQAAGQAAGKNKKASEAMKLRKPFCRFFLGLGAVRPG